MNVLKQLVVTFHIGITLFNDYHLHNLTDFLSSILNVYEHKYKYIVLYDKFKH